MAATLGRGRRRAVAAPRAACLTGTPRGGCLCPHVEDMLDSKLLGQMRMHDNLLQFLPGWH